MIKFLVLGENNINKEKLIDTLLMNNGLFTIAKYFITSNDIDHIHNNDYKYIISNDDLNICYKNNALLFIKTFSNNSYGITLDEYYNNNLVFMNTEDFNNISNKVFNTKDEIIIIWLDSKNHDLKRIKKEIYESNYLITKINDSQLKYMYFLDTSLIEIMDVIVEYLINEDKRKELLEKYS